MRTALSILMASFLIVGCATNKHGFRWKKAIPSLYPYIIALNATEVQWLQNPNHEAECVKFLDSLRTIENLNLDGAGLFELPEAIGELNQLTYLNLQNNAQLDWGQAMGVIRKLKNLETLDLSSNELYHVPDLRGLPQLKYLFLNSNNLGSGLDYEGLKGAIGLQELYLDANLMGEIPSEVTAVKTLTILSLNNNSISAIPEGVSEMPALECLHLNKNEFTRLDDSFSQLPELQRLFLRDNPIVRVSEVYKKKRAYHFRELDISGHQLNEVNAKKAQAYFKRLKLFYF